jgi:hypothetical protein
MFAVWNGMILAWHEAPTIKKGTMWHGFGFLIRVALLALLIPYIWQWQMADYVLYLSLWLWMAWVGYDATINLLRRVPGNLFQRFFYSGSKQSGTTSVIDKMIGDYLPMIKLTYTVLTIIYAVFYLTI